MTAALQYANWVLDPANDRETGRLIKLAAQRFLNDLKREDIYFDEKEAVRMCDMCEANLVQWEGDFEGVPIRFEPWQRFHLEQVFGWIRKDTGTRRFDEVFVQIAKKNGKSTEAACLMNDHVFFDPKVKTPKCFTAANNEEQAKIAVIMAGGVIEKSRAFHEL
jgi:phage terminase large subunit-like protein